MIGEIKNKAQCETAEHYLKYLEFKLDEEDADVFGLAQIYDRIKELTADIEYYKNNVGLRLVVDNT